MPPILIPPHKKRQQQNAAAIKRCYPIHPCHHLCLLFHRCLCIWERQSKGSCAPIGRMRILGETCLQMRFCKQTLLCIGRNRSFFPPLPDGQSAKITKLPEASRPTGSYYVLIRWSFSAPSYPRRQLLFYIVSYHTTLRKTAPTKGDATMSHQ